ncbi:MAG: hypothetical protein Q9210_006179, partial [Variospora velana]
ESGFVMEGTAEVGRLHTTTAYLNVRSAPPLFWRPRCDPSEPWQVCIASIVLQSAHPTNSQSASYSRRRRSLPSYHTCLSFLRQYVKLSVTGPTFNFAGFFSGDAEPAVGWLRRFDHELQGYQGPDGKVPPSKFISSLALLLRDTAADWAENHPDISVIIDSPAPTEGDVASIRSLLQERFAAKSVDIDLVQKADESIANYYKRTMNLMQRIGAKDRPATGSYSLMETAVLDSVVRAFVKGTPRCRGQTDFSLRSIYLLAEEARRTKAEVSKLISEESKDRELGLLRSLIQGMPTTIQSLPTVQVEALRAAFPSGEMPEWVRRLQATQGNPNVPSTPLPRQETWTDRRQDTRPDNRPPPSQNNRRLLGQTTGNRGYQRPQPQDLPDKSKSKNEYINGTLIWSISKDGLLCVKCGELGHIGKQCANLPLLAWE